jgi:hypothetical protein
MTPHAKPAHSTVRRTFGFSPKEPPLLYLPHLLASLHGLSFFDKHPLAAQPESWPQL